MVGRTPAAVPIVEIVVEDATIAEIVVEAVEMVTIIIEESSKVEADEGMEVVVERPVE